MGSIYLYTKYNYTLWVTLNLVDKKTFHYKFPEASYLLGRKFLSNQIHKLNKEITII